MQSGIHELEHGIQYKALQNTSVTLRCVEEGYHILNLIENDQILSFRNMSYEY